MPVTSLTKKERFLATIRGEETDRPPVWIMRQAGRYMPEYQELRRRYSFRDFCLDPEAAAAATLLPLRLLDIDALIIFNDILIPLEAMGLSVDFPEGGPRIANPIREPGDLARFHAADFSDPAVAHSLRRVRNEAGPDIAALGFCGAPFTLAAYAIEGRMSREQTAIRTLRYQQPELLHAVLSLLAETAANYLIAQVRDGGADGVQIFESWGGILSVPGDYTAFALRYQQDVIRRFRAACPGVPVFLYLRGSAGRTALMEASGADVLSIDNQTDLAAVRAGTTRCIQGNFDPMLMTTASAVPAAVDQLVERFEWRRGWIANLGHGITPDGTVAAAKALVQAVQGLAHRRPML